MIMNRSIVPPNDSSSQEKVFMARLAALNAALEGARAGDDGRAIAWATMKMDALLERYYWALIRPDTVGPPVPVE
jgi:hypothetical protein